MIDIDNVIKIAKEKKASDLHLICGIKPVLRIEESLTPMEEMDILEEEDIYEIYDYFVRGNITKDEEFKNNRKLDILYSLEDLNLMVNISYAQEMPTFTLKIVNNEIPTYEELGLPNALKQTIYEGQGLILISGQINSRYRNNFKYNN